MSARIDRPKREVAEFLHRNRSIHTHNLGQHRDDKTCDYCDLDAAYAFAAIDAAGFDVVARSEAVSP